MCFPQQTQSGDTYHGTATNHAPAGLFSGLSSLADSVLGCRCVQVAWIATDAATAASQAASKAVEELQAQLDYLQNKVSQTANAQAAPPLAALSGPLVATKEAMSFSELAGTSTAAAALTQQLLSRAASESAQAAPAAAVAEENWFEHVYDDAVGQQASSCPASSQLPSAATTTEQQGSSLTEGAFGSIVETAFVSVTGHEGGSASTQLLASPAAAAGAETPADIPAQQLLATQLALMSPAHQVAFLTELSSVVSSHATRLLATYHSDPELSEQLKLVQQQLDTLSPGSTAVSSGAPSLARGSESLAAFARSSSTGRQAPSMAAATATAVSGGHAEVLLGILDQVASLRAIGSATHPAINEALQRHESQIVKLLEAIQQLQIQKPQVVIAAGGENTAEMIAGSLAAGSSTTSSTEVDESAASSSRRTSTAAPAPDTGEAAATSSAAAAPAGETYAGEYNQRLSLLEVQLTSGLKVLSGLKDKLAPIQEVRRQKAWCSTIAVCCISVLRCCT